MAAPLRFGRAQLALVHPAAADGERAFYSALVWRDAVLVFPEPIPLSLIVSATEPPRPDLPPQLPPPPYPLLLNALRFHVHRELARCGDGVLARELKGRVTTHAKTGYTEIDDTLWLQSGATGQRDGLHTWRVSASHHLAFAALARVIHRPPRAGFKCRGAAGATFTVAFDGLCDTTRRLIQPALSYADIEAAYRAHMSPRVDPFYVFVPHAATQPPPLPQPPEQWFAALAAVSDPLANAAPVPPVALPPGTPVYRRADGRFVGQLDSRGGGGRTDAFPGAERAPARATDPALPPLEVMVDDKGTVVPASEVDAYEAERAAEDRAAAERLDAQSPDLVRRRPPLSLPDADAKPAKAAFVPRGRAPVRDNHTVTRFFAVKKKIGAGDV